MGEPLDDIDGFSFDEWAQLFKDNPDEFERCRKQALEAFIEKSPPEFQACSRELIERFDIIAEGKSFEERMLIAMIMLSKKTLELESATTLLTKAVADNLE